MHDVVLILHSWVRWAAIVLGILAIAATAGSRPGAGGANRSGLLFTIALDIQFVLGLILLFTTNAFSDFGATMRDPIARFYAVEHETIMIIAIALAHLGRVLARKASTPAAARTRALVFFTLSVVLLFVGTPWPGMRDHRPLFRI